VKLESRRQTDALIEHRCAVDQPPELPIERAELANMLRILDIPILVIDEELTVIAEINCAQMGWSQARGRHLLDLLSPVIIKNGKFRSSLKSVLAGERVEFEATLVGSGSRPKSYLVRMAPIPSDGTFLGMIAFFDISQEVELKEELNYLKDYSENVIKHIPSGLVVTDNDGKIVLANPAAREMLAATEELEGKSAEEVFGAKLGKALIQGRDQFKRGRLEPSEVTIRRMDSQEIVLGFRAAQLFDAHHRVVGMIIVFKDVTELKSLRSRLSQADKMAALGTLASGIAHEFNNLLGAMMGYAQLAKATGGIENYKKCVQVVFESCRRAQEIVHNLLSFSRRRKSVPEEMQLEDLMDQVLILVERDLEKHGIKVERDYRYRDAIVTDVGQLQQVLLNLIINARQAMENSEGERRLSLSTWEENGFVHIAVDDTGEGIAEEHVSRIFEPFFTTKGAGGTGLGLSLCYTLVKNLNGDISVESEPGVGSRFVLALPQRLPMSEPVSRARLTKTLKTTLEPKQVSVIAEDSMMRDLISKLLSQVGHRVVTAGQPDELAESVEMHKSEIAILDLPATDELSLERSVSELASDERGTVVLCGLSEEELDKVRKSARMPERVRLVSKPFEAHELIRAMEEVSR